LEAPPNASLKWFAATAQVPIGNDKGQSPMAWAIRELDDKKDKTVKWAVMIVFWGNGLQIYTTCCRSTGKNNHLQFTPSQDLPR